MATSTSNRASARLELANPGTVKINVKGAFIVDDDPRSKSPVRTDGVSYEGEQPPPARSTPFSFRAGTSHQLTHRNSLLLIILAQVTTFDCRITRKLVM